MNLRVLDDFVNWSWLDFYTANITDCVLIKNSLPLGKAGNYALSNNVDTK